MCNGAVKSPTEVTRGRILMYSDSKHASWRKELPFGVLTMAGNI